MTAMNDTAGDDARFDAFAELAALREKVETLMRDRAGSMLSDAGDHASAAARQAVDALRAQADEVSERVRAQPLVALGAAAALGMALGVLLRR